MAATCFIKLLNIPGNTNAFNPIVFRSCMNLLKKWSRQQLSLKEAGKGKKKKPSSKSRSTTTDASPMSIDGTGETGRSVDNPFADAEEEEESSRSKSLEWLTEPTLQPFVSQMIDACASLFNGGCSDQELVHALSSSSSVSLLQMDSDVTHSRHYFSLTKYKETHSHTMETMVDVTRTRMCSAVSTCCPGKIKAKNQATFMALLTQFVEKDIDSSIALTGDSDGDSDNNDTDSEVEEEDTCTGCHAPWFHAFRVIGTLIDGAHGHKTTLFGILLKSLLPNVLMTFQGVVSSTLPRESVLVQKATIQFIHFLVQKDVALLRSTTGSSSSPSVPAGESKESKAEEEGMTDNRILPKSSFIEPTLYFIQHMCVRSPDRSVYRKAISSSIVELLNGIPSLFPPLCLFLHKFARNSKIAFRNFAVEISSTILEQTQLLTLSSPCSSSSSSSSSVPVSSLSSLAENDVMMMDTDSNSSDGDSTTSVNRGIDQQTFISHGKILMTILLSRCSDRSANVRSKSITSLATVIRRTNNSAALRLQFELLIQDMQQKTGSSSMLSNNSAAGGVASSTPLATPMSKTRGVNASGTGIQANTSINTTGDFLQTPMNMTAGMCNDISTNSMAVPKSPLNPRHPHYEGLQNILAILHRRATDKKPLVRKAAVQALEAIILGTADDDINTSSSSSMFSDSVDESVDSSVAVNPHAPLPCSASDLQVFYDGCMDSSLAIRKQSIDSLSRLQRKYPYSSILQRVWLGAVLPLTQDRERSVQDKSLVYIRDLLLAPFSKCCLGSCQVSAQSAFAPSSIEFISITSLFRVMDEEMVRYLRGAIGQLIQRSMLEKDDDIVTHLNSALPVSQQKGVWLIASQLSHDKPDWINEKNLLKAWNALSSSDKGKKKQNSTTVPESSRDLTSKMSHMILVLSTIGNIAQKLKSNVLGTLSSYIFDQLSSLARDTSSTASALSSAGDHHPLLIKNHIKVMRLICSELRHRHNEHEKDTGANADTSLPAVPDWEDKILAYVHQCLHAFVMQQGRDDVNSSCSSDVLNDSVSSHAGAGTPSTSKVIEALYTLGELILYSGQSVPSSMITLVHSLLPPYLYLGMNKSSSDASSADSSLPTAASSKIPLPSSLRAHAFTALGKLCLRDEGLAVKTIPVLVRELEAGDDPIIRNNVLVIMCDLCRTFTAVVDRYLPSLTSCLRDSNQTIRKHTLMILSQLLQEDYLKWKGTMFFRFLTSLVDDSKSVRTLATQSLTALLQSNSASNSHVNRFQAHFVETMFYLNDCHAHPSYNKFSSAAKEKAFALRGNTRNSSKRFELYNYLLAHMTDEQKFSTTAKLVQDVFGAVVEGVMPYQRNGKASNSNNSSSMAESATADVIKDALLILASPHIKLKASRSSSHDDDEDDSALSAKEKKLAAAKGKILGKLAKKNTIENIVPIVIELKRKLEQLQSPLLRYLMLYLQTLLVDHKEELDDILATDKQLAAELEYDLRQFKKQQEALNSHRELLRLSVTPRGGGALGRRLSLSAASCTPISRSKSMLSDGRMGSAGGSGRKRRSSSTKKKRRQSLGGGVMNTNTPYTPRSTPPPPSFNRSASASSASKGVGSASRSVHSVSTAGGDGSPTFATPSLRRSRSVVHSSGGSARRRSMGMHSYNNTPITISGSGGNRRTPNRSASTSKRTSLGGASSFMLPAVPSFASPTPTNRTTPHRRLSNSNSNGSTRISTPSSSSSASSFSFASPAASSLYASFSPSASMSSGKQTIDIVLQSPAQPASKPKEWNVVPSPALSRLSESVDTLDLNNDGSDHKGRAGTDDGSSSFKQNLADVLDSESNMRKRKRNSFGETDASNVDVDTVNALDDNTCDSATDGNENLNPNAVDGNNNGDGDQQKKAGSVSKGVGNGNADASQIEGICLSAAPKTVQTAKEAEHGALMMTSRSAKHLR